MSDIDLDYLRQRLEAVEFFPFPWDGEDKNIGSFRSKEELIEWWCQPPGKVGQPYRDRAFYARELAMLSRTVEPRTVVEFGTSLGMGTCLLHWLNPEAELVTVDVSGTTFMPGDIKVLAGYLAQYEKIPCKYVLSNSWEYEHQSVDLCFIDADHSYEAVKQDSARAWLNRSLDHKWAIAWHDHNDRHLGVLRAVFEFCTEKKVELHLRADSDTVWIEG